MTLLAEIQSVMERTYEPAGINLEECVIGPRRRAQLTRCCDSRAEKLSTEAATFLHVNQENLHIAIYYSPSLIETLEKEDPRENISNRNISALISFIEEVTHGVHAAIQFRNGEVALDSASFACNLETQAKVDTYFIVLRYCYLLGGRTLPEEVRDWAKNRVFGDDLFDYRDPGLRLRYRLAHRLAKRFVDQIQPLGREARVAAVKAFQRLNLVEKRRYLNHLSSSGLRN